MKPSNFPVNLIEKFAAAARADLSDPYTIIVPWKEGKNVRLVWTFAPKSNEPRHLGRYRLVRYTAEVRAGPRNAWCAPCARPFYVYQAPSLLSPAEVPLPCGVVAAFKRSMLHLLSMAFEVEW